MKPGFGVVAEPTVESRADTAVLGETLPEVIAAGAAIVVLDADLALRSNLFGLDSAAIVSTSLETIAVAKA